MRLESPEVERLIVEIHSTVATLDERTRSMDRTMAVQFTAVTTRQDIANGIVAKIKTEQDEQRGGMVMVKWLIAVTLTVMSVGAAIAGVVLAIVSRGG